MDFTNMVGIKAAKYSHTFFPSNYIAYEFVEEDPINLEVPQRAQDVGPHFAQQITESQIFPFQIHGLLLFLTICVSC